MWPCCSLLFFFSLSISLFSNENALGEQIHFYYAWVVRYVCANSHRCAREQHKCFSHKEGPAAGSAKKLFVFLFEEP